jgi:hypothetical protein
LAGGLGTGGPPPPATSAFFLHQEVQLGLRALNEWRRGVLGHLLLDEGLRVLGVQLYDRVEVLVGRFVGLLLALKVGRGGVPAHCLLAEGELETCDEGRPLGTDGCLVAPRRADREPPVLGALAEVLGGPGDGDLVLHGMVSHWNGVHTPDEGLCGERVVVAGQLGFGPVEVRVLEVANGLGYVLNRHGLGVERGCVLRGHWVAALFLSQHVLAVTSPDHYWRVDDAKIYSWSADVQYV